MESLYELKKKEERLSAKYSEDHDWEIGYQMYYDFLKNDFYNFLLGIWHDYQTRKVDSLIMNDYYLNIPRNYLLEPFIKDFFDTFDIGYVQFNQNIQISFNPITFPFILDKYYEELQRVTYTMESPEKMQEKLNAFKQKKQTWIDSLIQEKELEDSLTTTFEEPLYDEYYAILKEMYFEAKHRKDKMISYEFPWYFDSKTITPFYLMRLVHDFLNNYELGTCYYDSTLSTLNIALKTTGQELEDAYNLEMERLNYYLTEARDLPKR